MRTAASVMILLFFGIGIGFIWGASSDARLGVHDHDHTTPINVTGDAPAVKMTLHSDLVAGWNLQLETQNFVFSPQGVNSAHQDGFGHAHVYANGQKLMRIYSPWTHIPALPKGEVEVLVVLNSNTHSPLSVNGTPVQDTTIVMVE